MNTAIIREVHTESGCGHNRTKELSGCPLPTPGKAAGGCAFDGAYSSLIPIADAAHIVHGPIGCIGNNWNGRGAMSSGPKLYRKAFTTNISNNDIVFGGEKKLYKAVLEIIKSYDPPAVFIYQTCVTAMIGDDLSALCQAVTNKTGVPVIPVESPGFIGTKNFGNRLSGDAVLRKVIGTMEPATQHDYNINLIGEFNIAGEFWSILPLLDRLGVRLICSLSGDARYHQVAMMHRADLNMMVCSRALLNVAKRLEENYSIPYFEGSFYGTKNIQTALRTIAAHFKDEKLLQKAEEIHEEMSARIAPELEPIKKKLQKKRVLLYTGGVKSWSLVGALQELGLEVVATGAKKSTEEDKQRIRELMGDDATLIMDGSAEKLLALYQERKADILLAGGRNQYLAIKARMPFVHINQEREEQYAGYEGFLKLAKNILHAMESSANRISLSPSPFNKED